MVDLHAHTSESDGSLSPAELVALAGARGLDALAITDHDTFAGFDRARQITRPAGLDLLCGIELSTKFRSRSVHLLGYFPDRDPGMGFRDWVAGLRESRHSRNERLLDRLKTNGIAISTEELRRRNGSLPGRPHIAAIMVEKGYVRSLQEAFDLYLDESASCYVERQEPSFAEAVERIHAAGGISSLAHPYRVTRVARELEAFLGEMRLTGLAALEVHHSEHSPADVTRYANLAAVLGFAVTGGSDFHGATKPDIELGTGKNGNLRVPVSVVERLRASI
jgi:predicted metal-dependent phosphoesterase TrpH